MACATVYFNVIITGPTPASLVSINTEANALGILLQVPGRNVFRKKVVEDQWNPKSKMPKTHRRFLATRETLGNMFPKVSTAPTKMCHQVPEPDK